MKGKSKGVQVRIQTLEPGWHDKDELLLHVAFQLLVDFFEKEHPEESIDWRYDALHRQAWKEIRALYHWWKITRPKRRSPLSRKRLVRPPLNYEEVPSTSFRKSVMPDRKKYAAYYRALKEDYRLETQWREEDQKNLHRLINIREYLWTQGPRTGWVAGRLVPWAS